MLLPQSVFPKGSNGYTGVLVTSKIVIFFCHDARHLWSHCLKLLKVYCYCIICLITILKVFNKNRYNYIVYNYINK